MDYIGRAPFGCASGVLGKHYGSLLKRKVSATSTETLRVGAIPINSVTGMLVYLGIPGLMQLDHCDQSNGLRGGRDAFRFTSGVLEFKCGLCSESKDLYNNRRDLMCGREWTRTIDLTDVNRAL